MNEFSGAVEFCPVCMRHGALADDIESGESSSDRRGKRRKRGEQKGQSWWFIDIRSRELVAAKGDPRVRIPPSPPEVHLKPWLLKSAPRARKEPLPMLWQKLLPRVYWSSKRLRIKPLSITGHI
jgi:hypothetical protein